MGSLMGRTPTRDHDPNTVRRINALKEKWGLKTDRELCDRLGFTSAYLAQLKVRGMTKLVSKLVDEILGENEGEKGQLWLAAA